VSCATVSRRELVFLVRSVYSTSTRLLHECQASKLSKWEGNINFTQYRTSTSTCLGKSTYRMLVRGRRDGNKSTMNMGELLQSTVLGNWV